MAGFSKLFPFLQRFHFPPSGELLYPREVDPEVRLTHELYRADVKHLFYLTSVDLSGAGAGANITLNLVPEPLLGYVSTAYIAAIFATGNAAAVSVNVQMRQTGSTPTDIETGLWGNALAFLTVNLTADHWIQLPVFVPIPRGNLVEVIFTNVLAGTTVRTRTFILQQPIETMNWQPELGGAASFVRTGDM